MSHLAQLSDVLKYVRKQLMTAHNDAVIDAKKAGHKPVLHFQECEIELSIQTEAGANGKVSVWVVEGGGESKTTRSNSIRVRFVADPSQIIVAKGATEGTEGTPPYVLPPEAETTPKKAKKEKR